MGKSLAVLALLLPGCASAIEGAPETAPQGLSSSCRVDLHPTFDVEMGAEGAGLAAMPVGNSWHPQDSVRGARGDLCMNRFASHSTCVDTIATAHWPGQYLWLAAGEEGIETWVAQSLDDALGPDINSVKSIDWLEVDYVGNVRGEAGDYYCVEPLLSVGGLLSTPGCQIRWFANMARHTSSWGSATNPATGQAWSVSDLRKSVVLGVRRGAREAVNEVRIYKAYVGVDYTRAGASCPELGRH